MKWKVDIDETINAVRTYIVEAETEDEVRSIIRNGEWDKTEFDDELDHDTEIHGIRYIEPYEEEEDALRS